MGKYLFIAEKPSVAQQFAAALSETNMKRYDGYNEGDKIIVTWCVGHLVTMSYPEVYDEKYKKWRLDTLPFLPEEYKYEVIKPVAKQFGIVSKLLNREDVERIYICTDSGREGEYIYRLVRQMAGVHDKDERRVWIDSQTDEEIKRGIKEAKDIKEYDNLSDSAYLRAKEDYLMGINFSRLLSLRYGNAVASFMNKKYVAIAVGRVMTCVLGMVVKREREIRDFVKTPFYRVMANTCIEGANLKMEWKAVAGSKYLDSPLLYKENGFKEEKDAIHLIAETIGKDDAELIFDEDKNTPADEVTGVIKKIEKKKEKKNAPLLYNLAEIQNDCSRFFKISPDQTLNIIQELYEKKLVTYPRTDARVLSTAISKEIDKNIRGLLNVPGVKPFAEKILEEKLYEGIAKTKYVNDKQITDHYAIIPTGQGFRNLQGCNKLVINVYELIVRRFLAIFYPAAIYEKLSMTVEREGEFFFANDKYLVDPGYLAIMEYSFKKKKAEDASEEENEEENAEEEENNPNMAEIISKIKKGDEVTFLSMGIREGETSPPKRYNSGSMILAMENAGKLIEDEELREQIKSSGIGTSATRAGILEKLVKNEYLSMNKKTQIITPTFLGEMIYDVVTVSMPSMLNPDFTASWEKGLGYVSEGDLSADEYMVKLENYIRQRTAKVMQLNNSYLLQGQFQKISQFYKNTATKNAASKKSSKKKEVVKDGKL